MAAILAESRPQVKTRLWFLDNLKVALTVLVILHHVGQAYGPGGWWYFQNPDKWPHLGFFFWVNATFFMGLFFLVSGYFMPGSFDRNGAAKSLQDRLIRFGVPILLFVLIINPLMSYVTYVDVRNGSLPFLEYVRQVYFGMGAKPLGWTGHWPDLTLGHLWFVQHLLVYALLYAAWRLLPFGRGTAGAGGQAGKRGGPNGASAWRAGAPSDAALLGYALGLAAVSLFVRLWYPIDKWVAFLGFIQLEPAHLPQYASMLVLGLVAARRSWALTMPAERGRRWLLVGLAAVMLAGAVRYGLLGEEIRQHRAMIFTLLEAFVAVGFSTGLITLFRERWNLTGALPAALSGSAYGAYLIHFPLAVAAQYAVTLLPAGAAVRFGVAGVATVLLSFAGAHLLRKLPGATRIL